MVATFESPKPIAWMVLQRYGVKFGKRLGREECVLGRERFMSAVGGDAWRGLPSVSRALGGYLHVIQSTDWHLADRTVPSGDFQRKAIRPGNGRESEGPPWLSEFLPLFGT